VSEVGSYDDRFSLCNLISGCFIIITRAVAVMAVIIITRPPQQDGEREGARLGNRAALGAVQYSRRHIHTRTHSQAKRARESAREREKRPKGRSPSSNIYILNRTRLRNWMIQ